MFNIKYGMDPVIEMNLRTMVNIGAMFLSGKNDENMEGKLAEILRLSSEILNECSNITHNLGLSNYNCD